MFLSWIFAECHFDKGKAAPWEGFTIRLCSTFSMSFIVDQQLGVLEIEDFGFRETEDCFYKLLNHCSLLCAEDLRCFAECLKDAITTMITHSKSDKENHFCDEFPRVKLLLVNDTLDVTVNIPSIASLHHRFRFILWLIVSGIFSLCRTSRKICRELLICFA